MGKIYNEFMIEKLKKTLERVDSDIDYYLARFHAIADEINGKNGAHLSIRRTRFLVKKLRKCENEIDILWMTRDSIKNKIDELEKES